MLRFKKIILILLFCFKILTVGKAASLKTKNIENEIFEDKKLTKRGHFGSEDGYGPPIHISSGVLHLQDTSHLKEPTIIYQGVLSHHLPIWNDISAEWQPIHGYLQTNTDGHVLQPSLNVEGFGLDLHKTTYSGGGLHTHIIGSSTGHGHNIINLNDKLDINSNDVDTKEKYYIKSYG